MRKANVKEQRRYGQEKYRDADQQGKHQGPRHSARPEHPKTCEAAVDVESQGLAQELLPQWCSVETERQARIGKQGAGAVKN